MSRHGFLKNARKKFERERVMSKHHEGGQHSVALVLDHLKPGFNVAKIFRTANVFSISEVILVGIPFFDVRAAMGGFKHTKHRSFADFPSAEAQLRADGYQLFALAVPTPTSEESIPALHECEFPEKTAFIIGHEEFGLSFDLASFPEVRPLTIPQFGQVQSLNASVAASIAVYEFLRQRVF